MRDYTGVAYASLPKTDHPDFMPRIRNMIGTIDYYLHDLSKGTARIQNGQVPSGSGASLSTVIDLADYLFLPGRIGGQTVKGLDSNPTVRIESSGNGLSGNGSIGSPALRLGTASSSLVDFRPYQFDATIELAFTDSSGVGIGVNFPSQDGTSAMRIASTTNRAFLQAGLKMSNGNVQNSRLTIGGTGATVGLRLNSEFQYIGLINGGTTGESGSVVTANTTRTGMGVDPFDFSSSSIANQPGGLYLAPIAGGSTAAPLIIQAGNNAIEVREAPTGASPNKIIGSLDWALGGSSPTATWYSSGTKHFSLANNAASDFIFTGGGTNQILRSRIVTGFADSVLLSLLEFGDAGSGADSPSTLTSRRAALSSSGGNVFSRLAILATSTILGPATSPAAPTGSRILTVVDSSATVLSGLTLTGGFFTVDSGAVNNFATSTTITSPDVGGVYDGSGFQLYDGSAFNAQITTGTLASDIVLTLPTTTGALISNLQTVTMTNKTLGSGTRIRIGSSAADTNGARFLRAASTTLYLTMDGTLLGGARDWKTLDTSGTVVVVGNAAGAAGVLGVANLTAQGADIGATNLTNAHPAGMYRVSAVLSDTTLDVTAGIVTLTIAWTDEVGATTATITQTLAATGRSTMDQVIYLASGNITYAITHTGIFGAAKYALRIRIESLG